MTLTRANFYVALMIKMPPLEIIINSVRMMIDDCRLETIEEEKMPKLDKSYLCELREEKESLAKKCKENSHTFRLLEKGKIS